MSPFILKWGIIACGRISRDFVLDALVDPKTRGVDDVKHEIAAVGSRDVQKAQEFINLHAGGDKSIKAYGSYEGVFSDKNVDVVYIGTPHTSHYVNAREAILAKKHVLCEKPVTVNAAELRTLLSLAKEHGVFFMEAMWTRFLPITLALKKIMEQGDLGEPILLHADLCHDFRAEELPKSHRILDPHLGGGALLDLGPYPLVWAIIALYEHATNKKTKPVRVSGSIVKTPLTGVDDTTSFTLSFGGSDLKAQAILSCSIAIPGASPGVIIRYRHGTIKVASPIFCPPSFVVQYFDQSPNAEVGKVIKEETFYHDHVGGGWHFQADEVARCVKAGKLESELWSHDKSLLEMEVFDEVRRQGGYELPDGVEQVR